MISLLESERFQNEYKSYRSKIDGITDPAVKTQAEALLKNLVYEVKKLDSQHQEMFSGNQLPMGLTDVRSGVLTIRKKLDSMLKDWDSVRPAS